MLRTRRLFSDTILYKRPERKVEELKNAALYISKIFLNAHLFPQVAVEIPPALKPKTYEQAMEFQFKFIEMASAHKDLNFKVCGWKVGATAEKIWKSMNLSKPFIGPLYQIIKGPTTKFQSRPAWRSQFESEFAFSMKNSIENEISNINDLLDNIDEIFPAFEVVGTRTGTWDIDGLSLIADIGGSHALIVGEGTKSEEWKNDWKKLSEQKVSLFVNNIHVCTGDGSMVLDNPIHSLQWAVNELIKLGKIVNKGDVITTGSMTGKQPVFKNDKIIGDFGKIGKLEVDII